MATSRNDVTGDRLVSRVPSEEYKDGWDRIFGGNKEKEMPVVSKNDLWRIRERELFNEAFGKNTHCHGCPHEASYIDYVPYGEGNVPMTDYECICGDAYACHYVQYHMKNEERGYE